MAFYDGWGAKLTSKGQEALQKTKELAEVARINAEIAELEIQIAEQYRLLGSGYFADHAADTEDVYPAMAEIRRLKSEIETKKKQTLEIRGTKAGPRYCAACGAELTPGARFCVQCGTPVGEAEVPEQARQEAEIPAPVVVDAAPADEVTPVEEAALAEPVCEEPEPAAAEPECTEAACKETEAPAAEEVAGEPENPYEAYFNKLQEDGYGGNKESEEPIRLELADTEPEQPEQAEEIELTLPRGVEEPEAPEAAVNEGGDASGAEKAPSKLQWPQESGEPPVSVDDPAVSAWVTAPAAKRPEMPAAEAAENSAESPAENPAESPADDTSENPSGEQ